MERTITVGLTWETVEYAEFLGPRDEVRAFESPRAAARFLMDEGGSIDHVWAVTETVFHNVEVFRYFPREVQR